MKRIYSLDLLRFAACSVLIIHHYQLNLGLWYEGRINFYGGRFDFSTMVEFFFILSGFFAKPLGNDEKIPQFIIKKWIRLMPMAIISALIYEIVCVYVQTLPGLEMYSVDIFGLIITILGISGWGIFTTTWVNGQLWYVSILMLCYIIFSLIDTTSKKIHINRNLIYGLLIITGTIFRYLSLNIPFCNIPCGRGYSGFFLGVLLRTIYQIINSTDKRYKDIIHILGGTVAIICTFLLFIFKNIPGEGIILSFAIYPGIILFALWEPIAKSVEFKFIGEIGKITYEMYIWHMPLILLLTALIYLGYVSIYQRYWFLFVFVAIVFFIGAFMYHLLEIPITKRVSQKKRII